MSRFGYGHIADSLPSRDAHVGQLLSRDPDTLPDAVDHVRHLDAVQFQGMSNACVGFALSSAIMLSIRAQGGNIVRPSPKFIYDIARLMAGGEPLVDTGCSPRNAFAGMQEYGVPRADVWPLTSTNVNDVPAFTKFRAASECLLTGYYRIPPGPSASLLMRQALAKGFCPAISIPVTQSLEDWARTDVPYTGMALGPELGRHMVCVVGYKPGALRILNSWGVTWSDEGTCWLDDAFVNSTSVQDRVVATGVSCEV